MKSIKLKISIITKEKIQEEIINATYDNTKKYIYYLEPDSKKTAVIYNFQNDILERDNKEIYLKLNFKENTKTMGTLELKDFQKEATLEIYTTKVIKEKTKLEVTYILNDEEYTYKIENNSL